ncbi:MAG: hypothetical protein NZ956_02000 [Candidatus Caldarchaeum sp.]|nr:hypothetical protein [Candidatus Caldarchaeum sp.]
MRTLVKLALSMAIAFAVTLLHHYLEQVWENPLQPVILSITVTALVVGFVANSASVAALATVVGGAASFVTAYLLGFNLWTPSPIPSDLPIIRSFIIGVTAILSSGIGYVSANLFVKKPKEIEKAEPVVPEPAKHESTEPEPVVERPVVPTPEPGMKICKFCQSIIPAESVFCPMCGVKLVESNE